MTMSSRCDVCVPSQAMISRLPNSAPTIPPIVFAAYTRADETRRILLVAADRREREREARAPQHAAGSTTHRQRTRSIWNVDVGVARQTRADRPVRKHVASSSTPPTRCAAVSSSWQTPSAKRGFFAVRAMTEPTLLPIPSPTRNAARMSENVYVVAPSRSDSSRVHTASAASAVAPDSAIAT